MIRDSMTGSGFEVLTLLLVLGDCEILSGWDRTVEIVLLLVRLLEPGEPSTSVSNRRFVTM